jgi:osmotically-inducible protein OsmY
MKKYHPLHVLTVIALLTGVLCGCATSSECTTPACVSDTKLTAAVQEQLSQHRELAAPNHVYVKSKNGVVYLSGQVATDVQRETAESTARATPGVSKVVNSISLTYQGR